MGLIFQNILGYFQRFYPELFYGGSSELGLPFEYPEEYLRLFARPFKPKAGDIL